MVPRSVANVFDQAMAEGPDREALVTRSSRFTYAELDRAANQAAQALLVVAIGTTTGEALLAQLVPGEDSAGEHARSERGSGGRFAGVFYHRRRRYGGIAGGRRIRRAPSQDFSG